MRILAFGDSNTYGWAPSRQAISHRLSQAERWPGVLAHLLGPQHTIIEEGLSGRTTNIDDPTAFPGANVSGAAILPTLVASHHPLDLVIIMLGSNDLKAAYRRSPSEVAQAVGALCHMVMTVNLNNATNYACPQVLTICPPALSDNLSADPATALEFAGALVKSRELPQHFFNMSKALEIPWLDANNHVTTDGCDGLHLTSNAHGLLAKAVVDLIETKILLKT